jgi:hypothetical protein
LLGAVVRIFPAVPKWTDAGVQSEPGVVVIVVVVVEELLAERAGAVDVVGKAGQYLTTQLDWSAHLQLERLNIQAALDFCLTPAEVPMAMEMITEMWSCGS